LAGNKIDSNSFAVHIAPNLMKVKDLDISLNLIDSLASESIAWLMNRTLENLNISGNNLTDEFMQGMFVYLASQNRTSAIPLRILNVESCKLTDRSVMYLHTLMDDTKTTEGVPFSNKFCSLRITEGNNLNRGDHTSAKLLNTMQEVLLKRSLQ
jgi:hypothetical protein